MRAGSANRSRPSRPGDDQNAADGGIDVRIELPAGAETAGFVPRLLTGFQVKQDKKGYAAGRILQEMRPNDILRPVFTDLAARRGAYVIVSGQESPADKPLNDRLKAMREAVADLPDAANLALDFYGNDRVAQWVNEHPGIVAWVRERIGKPLGGWGPYGNWSGEPDPRASWIVSQTCLAVTSS